MNKNAGKTLKLVALVAALLLVAGCKKAPAQETAAPETTVPVQTTAETVMGTTVETTQETEIVETVPKVTAPDAGSISYVEYLELSAEEQQAYFENFASADEFFAWLNAAKEEPKDTDTTATSEAKSDNPGTEESDSDLGAEIGEEEDW